MEGPKIVKTLVAEMKMQYVRDPSACSCVCAAAQVRNRDDAIQKLEKIMGRLSADPDSGFQLMPDTRWMVLLREPIYQVSSRHGHPLHGKGKKEIQLPWNGVAYLR